MNAMLKTFAVFILIATSNAFFVEYSEDAVKMFSTADTEAVPTIAEVINSCRDITFHISDDVSEDEVVLYADAISASPHGVGHRICGNYLGIDVANVGTYCNATYFSLVINSFEESSVSEDTASGEVNRDEEIEDTSAEESRVSGDNNVSDESSEVTQGVGCNSNEDLTLDEHTMQFTIHFKSDATDPFILEIPIFKLPHEHASANPNELKTWATENQVGLLSPTGIEKLSDTRKDKRLTLDFKWLSDLLKYGVSRSQQNIFDVSTSTDIMAFTSRPIVLSEIELEELKEWIGRIYYYSFGNRDEDE